MQDVEIGPSTIAQRCSLKSPDYELLTPLDWVVLDFADGHKSLSQLAAIVPADLDAIYKSYLSLRQQGLLTWSSSSLGTSGSSSLPSSQVGLINVSTAERLAAEVYLSPESLTSFRAFLPSLYDETLEIEGELQLLVEFLATQLQHLTAQEVLGLSSSQLDRESVKRAYLARTKIFHPDRYFRKNIGPFSLLLQTLFKATSRAFAVLSAN